MTPDQTDSVLTSRKIWRVILLTGLFVFNIFLIQKFIDLTVEGPEADPKEVIESAPPTVYKYGFNIDDFHIIEETIKPNSFLSQMLTGQGVAYSNVYQLVENIRDKFDVRQITAGKKCCYVTEDLCKEPSHFIYEPSRLYYYIFDLKNHDVAKVERPVTKEIDMASGVVRGSLWNSMDGEGFSWALIERMENALAWSLDFYSIQNGDEYKLIYEKIMIDGEVVAIGDLLGAYYKNFDNEYYAIHYENDQYSGFYDTEGRPTKRTFLKSPVKYSRISSSYSPRRFHPVLKRYKSHLGTDYAAPTGTPIYAVANGVITKASYTRGNGNYVKIKHTGAYSTQYLHMSRFAKGMRSGVHVKQGQVIGYVGQTGLATGPHVCFRFWKNGRQVNHRRLNFPPADPLPQEELDQYLCQKDFVQDLLDQIEIPKGKPSKLTKLEEGPTTSERQ